MFVGPKIALVKIAQTGKLTHNRIKNSSLLQAAAILFYITCRQQLTIIV